MPSSAERVQALVDNPRESIPVEVKDWFDPNAPEGVAKIAKTCIAMRNSNGGFLVVGFNDQTLAPNLTGAPSACALISTSIKCRVW